jgi:hypothetical protein
MAITPEDLQTLQSAIGSTGQAGQAAPNGHTVQGALNVMTQIAEDLDRYDLSVSDLPDAKQADLEAAQEDFQFWGDEIARLFGEDLRDRDNSIELPSGTVVDLPRQSRADQAQR